MRTVLPLIVIAGAACQQGTPCDLSTDCRNNEVCSFGECTYAFNRFYDVIVIQAEVPQTDGTGTVWDADSEGPDVYAEVGFSGESGDVIPTRFLRQKPHFGKKFVPFGSQTMGRSLSISGRKTWQPRMLLSLDFIGKGPLHSSMFSKVTAMPSQRETNTMWPPFN